MFEKGISMSVSSSATKKLFEVEGRAIPLGGGKLYIHNEKFQARFGDNCEFLEK